MLLARESTGDLCIATPNCKYPAAVPAVQDNSQHLEKYLHAKLPPIQHDAHHAPRRLTQRGAKVGSS